MTNEHRSPEEIEREIEEKRSDLTSNLEDLQDKFSIDTLVRQVGDQFREHGGDMGRSISNQVKANPIPLALTGIGLAWMMFGSGQKPTPAAARDDDGYSSAERDFRRTRQEQGLPYTPPTRYTPADTPSTPSWAREEEGGASISETFSDGADAVKDRASSTASAISDGATRAGDAVSDATASAKSSIASGAKSGRDGISAARNRLAEGTETLTAEARERVIAARRTAIEMRNSASHSLNQMGRSASRSASDGADAAADFYDRQPLVVGALALAVGAAIGGALSRTKIEDDLMGAQSDNLFDEAERIFEEEKSKALTVARSVKDEVEDIASGTKADLDSGAPEGQSAVDAVADQAKSAAKRVADKAKSTAEDENLGRPKS
ncbi:DUF3618 domain-containing protein [Jannaschia sp. CCS1]|uniref:DUF3618 domain-containing protein n=1 Tax=Jannaschia sp. (strain CCS1) TaxID=290400 RepID=UPI000053CD81|nr:DUF3618 domain-containing protein [Jannaschia sp. CCS1]ABD55128.1 hypothetical protein Jann_2211 [Jannaschia sp. CCS1]